MQTPKINNKKYSLQELNKVKDQNNESLYLIDSENEEQFMQGKLPNIAKTPKRILTPNKSIFETSGFGSNSQKFMSKIQNPFSENSSRNTSPLPSPRITTKLPKVVSSPRITLELPKVASSPRITPELPKVLSPGITPKLPKVANSPKITPELLKAARSSLPSPIPSPNQSPKRTPGLPNVAYSPKPKIKGLEPNYEYELFGYKPENDIQIDPWIPEYVEGATDITVGSYTPLGIIQKVPTGNILPQTPLCFSQTPRNQLLKKEQGYINDTAEVDPMLKATIILDCTKSEDRPYDYVAKRMRSITSITSSLKSYYKNVYKECPKIQGYVNHDQYEELLSIYENNQVYYQDCIESGSLGESTLKSKLSELEYWFLCIIEPKPQEDDKDEIESWKMRETNKLENGYTSHCDPDLHKYINPLPKHTRNFLIQYKL
jgi:hypothetical protein